MGSVHQYSKGWFVKKLRAQGIMVHPQYKSHLGLYKESELRNLYYRYVEIESAEQDK
ncbi:DUF2639 domain-containing protein [Lysinibacillus irui]|uniref:DUF2639 domain-containing protein n=1 Tax=Lysinibacillus irui TaxID=2998077 RepID=A0AAJ5UTU6_9BACI|nr:MULTISPECIES: DUF2639 domain-containing protein [Lysinibacillus]MEA0555592.1 DUF2639 domain-containing protein [Lysinibacillus irui]MEA0564978.1 DUF2639 domain-containing protein [Lysinibacillus irui]MEA0977177.1 DUF2639 domain-containing protein [Lysinibacillus irui]MEA1043331.1 DUF2639 domain-containing protein [Lysinibacillus irui]WDV05802.1 DUF2639 domain-containing protein [Lysinibacillus irui]